MCDHVITLMMSSSQMTIYLLAFKTHFFNEKVGKNAFSKQFLEKICVFDVPFVIQDVLQMSRKHQINFKAVWWDRNWITMQYFVNVKILIFCDIIMCKRSKILFNSNAWQYLSDIIKKSTVRLKKNFKILL